MSTFAIPFLLLFSVANCGPVCPDGYSQAPNGGDCFKAINFYDWYSDTYASKTFDQAEAECNRNSGGVLASFHSVEENNAVGNRLDPNWDCNRVPGTKNIGLKCTGKECKWDDGTPVTFTNFAGDGPSENDGEACYAISNNQQEWKRKKCGDKQEKDCWLCRVKARTIDCTEGEIEFRGGCLSVHTTPLDQKTAEASCPGGGHLVSIHGSYDTGVIKNAALEAGATGTIYVGGQYSNGQFEWIDGSYQNYGNWATGFPNPVFGNCVQMLLDSEFGVQGQWTNIDCTTKQPYICYRDGAYYDPSPIYTKSDMSCPPMPFVEDIHYKNGNMYSPNYPVSIIGDQNCTYSIETKTCSLASIYFTSYDCQGCSFTFYNYEDRFHPNIPFLILNDTSPPVIGLNYSSKAMTMEIHTSTTEAAIGTGWAAKYIGQPLAHC